MAVKSNFFSERAVRQQHSCPGSGGVTIPGGVSQSRGDVALKDVGSGHGGGGVELGWMISEVFFNLNDSVKSWNSQLEEIDEDLQVQLHVLRKTGIKV